MNGMTGNRLPRALVPSLEVVAFLLFFWLSLWLMPDMLNSDGDLGRHLTVGEYILDNRTIPTRDVFSHTRAGEPLVLHEWLSEVVYALAARAAGLNGAAWLTALLLATIYFVLAVGLRLLGVSAPIAFAAVLAAYLAGAIHHLPRPHLFSLLLFTVLVLLLELYLRQARRLYLAALLPLMVLWANFNGAFVLAFIVLAIYILGAVLDRAPRRAAVFALALAGCFLVALINPFGISLPQYVFSFMGSRFLVDNTVEYLSPNFHNISAWFFAAWIVFSIALLARARTTLSWTHVLLLCVWTAFGLYSARNIANYAQIAALVLAPVAEAWLVTALPAAQVRLTNLDRMAPRAGGWMWAVVVVAFLILIQARGLNLDVRGSGNKFTNATFPVDAVTALARNPPPGNGFNEYTWGGYLLYRLFPSRRVFIDGDNDFYGEALVRDYLDIINARAGWQDKLAQYDVRWVIVPLDRPLALQLMTSSEWVEFYRDATAGVWVRRALSR